MADVLTTLARRRARTLQAQPAGVNVMQAASPAAPAAPAAPAVPSAGTNATRLPGSDSGLMALASTQAQPKADPGVRTGSSVSAPLKFDPNYGVPASGPSAGNPDPRDATYWANVAKLRWQGEQAAQDLARKDTESDIATNRALTDLATGRNYEDRATRQALSAGNLGSSTTALERFSREESGYGLHVSRAIEDHDREEAARQAAIEAISKGFTLDEAIEYAGTAARYADIQRENARNERPDPTPAAAAPAPYSPPPAGLSPGPAAGPPPGKNYWWTGTRWVPIGKSVPASHGNLASGPPPGPNYAWDGQRWRKVR